MQRSANFTAFLYIGLFLVVSTESNCSFLKKPMQAISGLGSIIKAYPIKSLGIASATALSVHYGRQWYLNYQNFQQVCRDTGDIFMLGDRAFCTTQPPAGMTRADWYKQKLEEQEQYLKAKILNHLKLTPQEFYCFIKFAQNYVREYENTLCADQYDICGTWTRDYQKKEWIRYENQQKVKSFTITQDDIAYAKQVLQDFGYQGKIVTLNSGHYDYSTLTAYDSLIAILPGFFSQKDTDKIFSLRHELSHIQHQDFVFDNAIITFLNFLLKDGADITKKWSSDTFDAEKLQQLELTPDDIKSACDLLKGQWHTFKERRADTEALLALKDNLAFQEKIKDSEQYQGYPLSLNFNSAYEKESRVAYLKDFLEGLCNDAKMSVNG